MQKRNNDIRFVDDLINNIGIDINVAQLCSVVSIDKDKKKLNAQPLALDEKGNKRGMLLNVNVGRLLINEVKVGDVVVVIFLDRSSVNFDGTNSFYKLDNKRTHQINDSFVIEVY